MMSQLPEEVIRVHEKSLRMLDESQEQLKNISEIFRKAVVRLTIAARGDDERLNSVLEQIKSTAKNEIDTDQMDVYLDKLLVENNRTENSADSPEVHGFHG